jgi:hypothetical protein
MLITTARAWTGQDRTIEFGDRGRLARSNDASQKIKVNPDVKPALG